MTPTYIVKLDFTTQKTSVEVQKIDSLALQTYGMVSASSLLQNRLKKIPFFEKIFSLANTNIKVVLEMLFLLFSNANIRFNIKKFTWRSYNIAEALPITSQLKLINKRKFAKAVLDINSETFVVYVAALEAINMAIHLS